MAGGGALSNEGVPGSGQHKKRGLHLAAFFFSKPKRSAIKQKTKKHRKEHNRYNAPATYTGVYQTKNIGEQTVMPVFHRCKYSKLRRRNKKGFASANPPEPTPKMLAATASRSPPTPPLPPPNKKRKGKKTAFTTPPKTPHLFCDWREVLGVRDPPPILRRRVLPLILSALTAFVVAVLVLFRLVRVAVRFHPAIYLFRGKNGNGREKITSRSIYLAGRGRAAGRRPLHPWLWLAQRSAQRGENGTRTRHQWKRCAHIE